MKTFSLVVSDDVSKVFETDFSWSPEFEGTFGHVSNILNYKLFNQIWKYRYRKIQD